MYEPLVSSIHPGITFCVACAQGADGQGHSAEGQEDRAGAEVDRGGGLQAQPTGHVQGPQELEAGARGVMRSTGPGK
jgi:hypothetical protein